MFDDRIVIRPPLLHRVAIAVFGVCWCGLVGSMAVGLLDNQRSRGLVALPLGMLAVGLFRFSAELRTRVVADDTGLHVVNHFREHHYPADTIIRFVQIRSHWRRGGYCLAMVLASGRLLRLRATWPSGRERQLQQLRDWLATQRVRSVAPRQGWRSAPIQQPGHSLGDHHGQEMGVDQRHDRHDRGIALEQPDAADDAATRTDDDRWISGRTPPAAAGRTDMIADGRPHGL